MSSVHTGTFNTLAENAIITKMASLPYFSGSFSSFEVFFSSNTLSESFSVFQHFSSMLRLSEDEKLCDKVEQTEYNDDWVN